ncbi:MAG TPA: hypothetical protein DGZ24_07680 [Rhodospirillaceae bacterium]|nr:hypothetical protein [Rhodospirillaceae bacterium]
MSRRDLRQNVFELPENIPRTKRKNALDLLVRKWSPFPSTEYETLWAGDKASVYAWNREQVEADIKAAGYSPKRCSVWPETFLREPISDGVRLATVADGFEGQMWRQGFLTATRWWDELPEHRDWIMFLRSAGTALQNTPPAQPQPTETQFLHSPWTASSTPATDIWSLFQTDRAAAFVAAVIAVPFLYLLSQALVLSIATNEANTKMKEMAEANQTVRVDRNAALSNIDVIESHLSLEQFPAQIKILSHASNILGNQNLTISEWVYDSGNLDLALVSPRSLDSTFYIEAFEKDNLFSNVSGSSGVQQRTLRLNMQVSAQEWSSR